MATASQDAFHAAQAFEPMVILSEAADVEAGVCKDSRRPKPTVNELSVRVFPEQRLAKAAAQVRAIARCKLDPRRLGRDLDRCEDRTGPAVERLLESVQFGLRPDGFGHCESATARDGGEIDAMSRVRALHAGLRVEAVVNHDHREVRRARSTDRGKRPQPHQHLAVAGHDNDAPPALGVRESEPDHRGAAHRAPEIKGERRIARGECIVGRRAEPGDDERVAAAAKQLRHHGAAFEQAHFRNTFAPIKRWPRRTATERPVSNATVAAARAVSTTRSASSTRYTITRIASSAGLVPCPMAICHGLNSPNSPRIVISIRSGIRHSAGSESALMQLPTPLDY